MKLDTLVNQLEAYLQEERGVQGRLADLLDLEERSVRSNDTDGLERGARGLEAELALEPRREARRRALCEAISTCLGVPAGVVTVGSLAERLGPRGERLARLRQDVREAALSVRSKARRLAIVARGHQEVLADVLRALAGGDDGASGALVDAEA